MNIQSRVAFGAVSLIKPKSPYDGFNHGDQHIYVFQEAPDDDDLERFTRVRDNAYRFDVPDDDEKAELDQEKARLVAKLNLSA